MKFPNEEFYNSNSDHANVQLHSGSQANMAAYAAVLSRYYLKEDHHKVDHQQRSDFLAALLDLLQHTLPRRFQRRLVHLFRLLNF